MGTIIRVTATCLRIDHGVSGTIAIQRNSRIGIERSEIDYMVDVDTHVIALAPKICFRQSDAALGAEAVRDTLDERSINAETFSVVLTGPPKLK